MVGASRIWNNCTKALLCSWNLLLGLGMDVIHFWRHLSFKSSLSRAKVLFGITVGLLFAYGATAQQSTVKTIVDSQTRRPVSYATVYYLNTKKGEITDESGTFRMQALGAKPGDSVRISALGYHTALFEIQAAGNNDTLFLDPAPIQLSLVTIIAKGVKKSTKILGYARRLGVVANGYSPNSNMITATFIAAEELGGAAIRKVVCSTIPKKSELVSTFRVRVRLLTSRSDNGLPHKDLLLENIVVDLPINAHTLEFDLTAHSLLLPPTGVWVAVESLGFTDKLGMYWPISDTDIGKATYKNTKKIKAKSITSIAPMYQYVRQGELQSAYKPWYSSWNYMTLYPKMTLCFGLEVEVSK